MENPTQYIRNWIPHIVLLALLLFALLLLGRIFTPLVEPLLLAAALAMLTYPVLYSPINSRCLKLFKALPKGFSETIAASVTIVILGFIFISPVILLLLSTVNSLSDAVHMIVGVITQNPEEMRLLIMKTSEQIIRLNGLVPGLDLDKDTIRESLEATLIHSGGKLTANMLNFLFQGSSRIAQIFLALISLFFFYRHGPAIMRKILNLTPLSSEQQNTLIQQHQVASILVLKNILGMAVLKGVLLAAIVVLIRPSYPFILIALLASLLSLLPLVGTTILWLPLVAFTWKNGHELSAILIGIASCFCQYGIDWLREHWLRYHGREQDDLINFGLFLGLVGGILSFGPQGLIIGPVIITIFAVLGKHGLPIYQIDPNSSLTKRLVSPNSPCADVPDSTNDADSQSDS